MRGALLYILLLQLLLAVLGCSRGETMNEINYVDFYSDKMEKELIKAVMAGDIESIRSLTKQGVNLSAVGSYENTPLRMAIKVGQKKSVRALLELGVNPNLLTPKGVAAAKVAVTFQKDPQFLELLFEYGLDPNLKSGDTPLVFFAMTEGNWRQYDMLLAKGADINSKDTDGSSPIVNLVLQLEYDRAKELLVKGADPRVVSVTGINMLDLLVDYQRRLCGSPTPDCHKRAELLKLMQERGMEVPPGLPYM